MKKPQIPLKTGEWGFDYISLEAIIQASVPQMFSTITCPLFMGDFTFVS
jgi:hypothetical protein